MTADAPRFLSAAGFADCLVRSVAQIDWWMSHRLLGSVYATLPYIIQDKDEAELNARAAGIAAGDIAANGYLHRVLTLCGLGVSFTGMSNHGSMGEHQVSHYIDCFAGNLHPGTLHGQQVGVATLTMARLQRRFLDSATPPVIKPTRIDPEGMAKRMGKDIAAQCYAEIQPKVFDERGADEINGKLAELWPTLRGELEAFAIPVAEMERLLHDAGGPMTAGDLGLPVDFYREAVVHCREMRNRYSFLDIAADAGWLEDFAAGGHSLSKSQEEMGQFLHNGPVEVRRSGRRDWNATGGERPRQFNILHLVARGSDNNSLDWKISVDRMEKFNVFSSSTDFDFFQRRPIFQLLHSPMFLKKLLPMRHCY